MFLLLNTRLLFWLASNALGDLFPEGSMRETALQLSCFLPLLVKAKNFVWTIKVEMGFVKGGLKKIDGGFSFSGREKQQLGTDVWTGRQN